MNIGILSYEYPPDTGFGGIGTYSYYHAHALARLGHRVHVFAGALTSGTFHSEDGGVRVTRVKKEGWVHHLLEPARARRCWWFNNRVETAYGMYVGLRAALKRESFDVIEAPECGADAAAVSMLLDVPVAVRFHSPAKLIMHTYDTPKRDRELTAFVEQIAIDRASIRTSCSRFLANEVVAKMRVPSPVHVIPNGIDVDLFDRDEGIDVHERFGLPRNALTVLFANRLEPRKGIHLFGEVALHTMKRYPHVHFVVAGRDLFGHVANEILPKVQEAGCGPRFHVLGGRDLSEVRALLKRTDIFCLPSVWENCPYSCLEAMTASRAIVASDCGGMPELITDRVNGLLAHTGDAESFTTRLEELIERPDLRERLGRMARHTVETRLTNLETARRTVDIYRGVPAASEEFASPGV